MAGGDQRKSGMLWFKFNEQPIKAFEVEDRGHKLDLSSLHLADHAILLNQACGLVDSEGWTKYDKRGLQVRLGTVGNSKKKAIIVTRIRVSGVAWVALATRGLARCLLRPSARQLPPPPRLRPGHHARRFVILQFHRVPKRAQRAHTASTRMRRLHRSSRMI